jgi:hypothetical protein
MMEIFLPIGGGRKINIVIFNNNNNNNNIFIYFWKKTHTHIHTQVFYIENELFSIVRGGLAIFNSTNCWYILSTIVNLFF